MPKEGAISIANVSFDIKFELFLFKSKSESDLSHIVLDEARFQEIVRNSSLKVICLTKEDKEFFWDALIAKLKEDLENLKENLHDIKTKRNTYPILFFQERHLEHLIQNIPHSHFLFDSQRQTVQNLKIFVSSSSTVMANQFSPLTLPTQLHPLPNNYARIRQFGFE